MAKNWQTSLLALGLIISLGACSSSIKGEKYLDVTPKFDLFDFFDGEVTAWGIVQNRSGEVTQRFQVKLTGNIQDGVLVLDEVFEYGLGDGVKNRVWTISQQPDGYFTGKADDILNDAQGTSYGNAFNFAYAMDLPVDDTTYKVKFDDWFWAFDNNTMMNRSYIRKFGIVMAEVTIFMQKQ